MNTCSTCKHWKREDWRVDIQKRSGGEWGLCELLTTSDDYGDKNPVRPAEAASFSEGIGGDFVTTPEFGCTEWIEAK